MGNCYNDNCWVSKLTELIDDTEDNRAIHNKISLGFLLSEEQFGIMNHWSHV